MTKNKKCRLWDKVNKEMLFADDPLDWLMQAKNELDVWYDPDREWNKDDLIRMDSTGYKDTNGRNVYDGDIIKCRDRCGNEKVDEVIWGSYSDGEFVNNVECWLLREMEVPLSDHEAETIGHNSFTIERIGNIYENPELTIKCNRYWETK